MFISIGIDCGNADQLRSRGLREQSLPFDWVVSYRGISDIIKNDFIDYLPQSLTQGYPFTNKYNVRFIQHGDGPCLDREKMIRRIERFRTILDTYTNKITFIRKGHAGHHHGESDGVKCDLQEAEDLYRVLIEKYPSLQFEIMVVLVCAKCFDPSKEYKSDRDQIKIYNIATREADNEKYIELMNRITTNDKL